VRINGVPVRDTYAEAFDMWGTRLVITAASPRWARTAAMSLTGFATSVIGCKLEGGSADRRPGATPDGRRCDDPAVRLQCRGSGQRAVGAWAGPFATCATTPASTGAGPRPSASASCSSWRRLSGGQAARRPPPARAGDGGQFLCQGERRGAKAIGAGTTVWRERGGGPPGCQRPPRKPCAGYPALRCRPLMASSAAAAGGVAPLQKMVASATGRTARCAAQPRRAAL
jgi:hypothetical protein